MANATLEHPQLGPHERGPLQRFADPLDFRDPWSSVLYVLGDIYIFFSLHLVVHKWFAVAIEMIVEMSEMNEDVAGATLMAIGTSLPELVSGIIGVFVPGAGDTGLGTVVGSLVFNLLVITGGCIIVFPGGAMRLSPAATVRDVTFQIVVIGVLVWAFSNKEANVENVIVFLGLYIVYVLVCWKSKAIAAAVGRCHQPQSGELPYDSVIAESDTEAKLASASESPLASPTTHHAPEESQPGWPPPCTVSGIASFILRAPLAIVEALCTVTIPDCTSPTWQKCINTGLVLCLVMSILWIGLLVLLMIEWAVKAGELLGVSKVVMGLTLCAAGTSVPDCMCSLIVAGNGKGDMAISNVFGSNAFDILIAMAVPWALRYSINGTEQLIRMEADGFASAVVILALVMSFYVACVAGFRCQFPRWIGYVFVALYALFVLYVFVTPLIVFRAV